MIEFVLKTTSLVYNEFICFHFLTFLFRKWFHFLLLNISLPLYQLLEPAENISLVISHKTSGT